MENTFSPLTGQLLLSSTAGILTCALFLVCRSGQFQSFLFEFLKFGRTSSSRFGVLVHSAIKDGYYKQNKNGGYFSVKAPHADYLIIPPKFVDFVKNIPESKATFQGDIEDSSLAPYTSLGYHLDIVAKSTRIDLTKHLGGIMPDLLDETKYALSTELPDCDKEWIPIKPFHNMLRIVSLVSGRVFVGPELNRNEAYIESTVNYTTSSMMAAFAQRLAAKAAGQEPINDMLTWNMHNVPKFDPSVIAAAQLLVAFAAIHTTSNQLTNMLYDLAAHPEYHEPLRLEIEEVLASGSDHALFKGSLPKLRKLDSFMKESQRLYPPALLSITRRVNSPIELPDGRLLQKGSYFAVANSQICRDPEIFENPDDFDMFRFERMRSKPGEEHKYQFVTTSLETMAFGHGAHACPGRFFASNEIKMIMVEFLRCYEVRLPPGAERPSTVMHGHSCAVSTTAEILIRKRA
ncbi:uncharacterized protein BP5553_10347 [Venustampulla echinocandica]|uniref:Cytochrome P450 n=1 Tax=Venustampulla echinocandica TaxID=2656787 RepID=A0A370T9Y7_9HELO|nr:uncharacterized protein BP5553_10347 [Venustampulla echinocandica]RDL30469.1 hypothetical protein BP5553_10347 [Venustampulla echinocandica]